MSDFRMKTNIGTFEYLAPEIDEGNYSYKVDIYSFAILCYEIITWNHPYPDIDTIGFHFYLNVIKRLRPNLDCIESKVIKEFLIKCWDSNPNKRPTFSETVEIIKRKSFMNEMNANEEEVSRYLQILGNTSTQEEELLLQNKLGIIKKIADQGDLDYKVVYGYELVLGKEVPKDIKMAQQYFKEAADMGDSLAMLLFSMTMLIFIIKVNKFLHFLFIIAI